MKHCINCGDEIRDEAELCGNCGVNQTTSLEGSYEDREENEKYCKDCGELINKQAEVCPKCGVRQIQQTGTSSSGDTDRQTAGILALLLGGIGAHKFYQGRTNLGILYLCFFWTFIPAILSLVEGIQMLLADDEEYQRKYAGGDVLGK